MTCNKQRVVVLVALVLLAACGGGGEGREPLPWSDDFSNPASGWKTESDSSAEVVYQDGVMRVFVKTSNGLAWASAGRAFSDFRLTVEATQVAGPDDNEYGVLARMQDPDHFYLFSISGDGYYLVSKYDGKERKNLTGNWSTSDAIHQGAATNILEITCRGSAMTFIVNGVQLARVEDTDYRSGDIGLYVGTFFESGAEVHFDNLRVEQP